MKKHQEEKRKEKEKEKNELKEKMCIDENIQSQTVESLINDKLKAALSKLSNTE